MSITEPMTMPKQPAAKGGDVVDRHRLSTRLWHWTNAITIVIMLMSGLMIFNAHPRLYWGTYGANPDYAWLQIGATEANSGFVRVGSVTADTTGVLGRWTDSDAMVRNRTFLNHMPEHFGAARVVWRSDSPV